MSLFGSGAKPNEREPRPNRVTESASPFERSSGDLLEPQEAKTSEVFPAPVTPTSSFSERETPISQAAADQCPNVVAAGSKWTGSLNISDSVRIEGQLSGEIVAKGTVHIAEGARVDAKIEAAFIVISGSFKGQIKAGERLELMPKSRVEGELVTKILNVHEGAVVDGSIQMQAEGIAAPRRAREEAEDRPLRTKATAG